MVDYDILLPNAVECVLSIARLFFVAAPEPQIPDNDVARFHIRYIVFEANAIAGSRLTRNGQIALPDSQRSREGNGPRYGKHHRARPLLLHRPPQRPNRRIFGRIKQIFNHIDRPPAPARREPPGPFSTGKSEGLSGWRLAVGSG